MIMQEPLVSMIPSASPRGLSSAFQPLPAAFLSLSHTLGLSLSQSQKFQVHACFNQVPLPQTRLPSLHLLSCSNSISGKWGLNKEKRDLRSLNAENLRRKKFYVASSSNVSAPLWDNWAPEKSSKAPSLSDILWPSAGAFAAMALLGKIDQILAPKGISMTIAPLGAVCAVLFATPASPGARKYNMFLAQIGCAAIGVLAFSIFGPGWLARSAALSAAIAFMIFTRSVHPPAASLPLLFIDGIKLHNLKFWYVLFPGAAGCILLCLIQEMVSYLKDNLKF